MKPSAARVLAALRDGPKTTGELLQPDVGGRNFPARVHELRHEHGFHISERYVRPGQHAYTLLAASPGPLAWPGPYVACLACSFRFDEPGSSDRCPRCGSCAAWLEEHLFAEAADAAASAADPEEVARVRAWVARRHAERDRRAQREMGVAA